MKQLKFNPKERQRKRRLQEEYLEKKINGHGGSYVVLCNDRVKTDYVGSKSKIRLLFINIHLWYIWRFK